MGMYNKNIELNFLTKIFLAINLCLVLIIALGTTFYTSIPWGRVQIEPIENAK